ncbi:hypothetical protein K439DRAFT_1369730 [Ramaria rubella]|nr:hypothetical protein K439DRAFT_1369730 [Ramaria rubella]
MHGQPTQDSDALFTALTSLILGLTLLYICLVSLTVPHRSLRYLRLALTPPAIFCFRNFGFGKYAPHSGTKISGIATVALYGIMRVLEVSTISFWDATPPHWVKRTERKNGVSLVQPLPQSCRDRCFYAFDLLTSLRGSSWSSHLEWDWIPLRFRMWPSIPRRQFLVDNMKSLFIQYLTMDMCDAINKSRVWDPRVPNAVTSLSLSNQLLFTLSLCTSTILAITIPYTIISSLFVMCGSSPRSWPPMFNSPFYSASLKDFWSNRWHWMFRRVFNRLAFPFGGLSRSACHNHTDVNGVHSIVRPIIAFALSTLLHLSIMHRVTLTCREQCEADNGTFWDRSTIRFFMAQPVGLLLESTVITYLGDWLCMRERRPQMVQKHFSACWQRDVIKRVYVWIFLLWTGRWWADKWVQSGLFHEKEKVVPLTIVRGLWRGQWTT